MPTTMDAMKIFERMTGNDPELRKMIADAGVRSQIAQMINDARSEAGISQKELAKLVGTTQSVIARLEGADYEGPSLSMLRRIATWLNQKVEIALVEKATTRLYRIRIELERIMG